MTNGLVPTLISVEGLLQCVDQVADRLGRSVPPIVEITYLRGLPMGTFGRAWADHLDQHQLQPFTTGPRRKQLHDGVHVLTSYGTDLIGEAEVQAFLVGSCFQMVNLLLGLGLVRRIYRTLLVKVPVGDRPTFRQTLWQRLHRAYDRGRIANFDPDAWKPELLWEQPLADVQQSFRITA